MSRGSSLTANGLLRPTDLNILSYSLRYNKDHRDSRKKMSLTDEKIIAMYLLMAHCIASDSWYWEQPWWRHTLTTLPIVKSRGPGSTPSNANLENFTSLYCRLKKATCTSNISNKGLSDNWCILTLWLCGILTILSWNNFWYLHFLWPIKFIWKISLVALYFLMTTFLQIFLRQKNTSNNDYKVINNWYK